MTLSRLTAARFRNFDHVELNLSPGLNLVHGDNSSGKTSILESCYFLSSARSFRSATLDPVIQRGAEECLVNGEISSDTRVHRVGVLRNRDGRRRIRLNDEDIHRASVLARILPCLVLGPESVELLLGPPAARRRFLNWGLFHVEPEFAGLWESANRCLRQRNLLLRQGTASDRDLEPWTSQLAVQAEKIHAQREAYVLRLQASFSDVVLRLAGMEGVQLRYYRGWDKETSLLECYRQDIEADRERGFTRRGFQRADVRISVAGQPATDVCSRGELKAVAWSMILSQGFLSGNQDTLYLVDDLAAEFDKVHRKRVCEMLQETGQQILLTGIEHEVLLDTCEGNYARRFHVEHGEVSEVA